MEMKGCSAFPKAPTLLQPQPTGQHTILFSVSIVSMSKTVLFQAIQFSTSMQFISIWAGVVAPDRVLSMGQSGHGIDGIDGVLLLPQRSSITQTSDCLVSYPGHSLTGVLLLCRDAFCIFYSPSRVAKRTLI